MSDLKVYTVGLVLAVAFIASPLGGPEKDEQVLGALIAYVGLVVGYRHGRRSLTESATAVERRVGEAYDRGVMHGRLEDAPPTVERLAAVLRQCGVKSPAVTAASIWALAVTPGLAIVVEAEGPKTENHTFREAPTE